MKHLGYFKKLSLAARWLLPREEAEETVRDYRELLEDMGEMAFQEKFGGPVRAVLAAVERKKAAAWHLALLLFAVLDFLPVIFLIKGFYSFPAVLLGAAALITFLFVWFGADKTEDSSISKGLAASCGLIVLFFVILCGILFYFTRNYSSPNGRYLGRFLEVSIVLSAVFGLAGIICARLFHRRWRAVVILCVTAAFVSMYFLSLIQCMDPQFDSVGALPVYFRRCVLILVCGAVIAGVSLCSKKI